MKFKAAVTSTRDIASAYRKGLQALKAADRSRIHCRNPRILCGSIDLDSALRDLFRNEPRWDYGIGIKRTALIEEAIWVEVHPASSHHIDEMLSKLGWLTTWLTRNAPALERMSRRFIWVSSGSISLTAGSPQRKKIAAAGLEFAGGKLLLP